MTKIYKLEHDVRMRKITSSENETNEVKGKVVNQGKTRKGFKYQRIKAIHDRCNRASSKSPRGNDPNRGKTGLRAIS